VYAADFFASLKPDLPKLGGVAERVLGFFRLGTGFWLMYLVFAVALNFILKYTLPLLSECLINDPMSRGRGAVEAGVLRWAGAGPVFLDV
jgi:hypothetical protein